MRLMLSILLLLSLTGCLGPAGDRHLDPRAPQGVTTTYVMFADDGATTQCASMVTASYRAWFVAPSAKAGPYGAEFNLDTTNARGFWGETVSAIVGFFAGMFAGGQ